MWRRQGKALDACDLHPLAHPCSTNQFSHLLVPEKGTLLQFMVGHSYHSLMKGWSITASPCRKTRSRCGVAWGAWVGGHVHGWLSGEQKAVDGESVDHSHYRWQLTTAKL